ncbi:MAG: hypothetical protein K0S41_2374 [Anaerocolumna sp.]|jgi:DNA-binding transcriptional MerR regulator|nr:hypothetical protein [Anaerocolumna sp.]
MKIGEIAAFFNVSVKAVRIYEQKGIIKPAKIDSMTGYRYYTADQVGQINSLLELKALGFTLTEIQNIMSGKMTSDKLIDALQKKRMAWQESISIAENKMDAIDTISKRLTESKAASKLHELTDEQRAWLMVKMVCVEDLRGQSVLSEAIWL